MTVPHPRAAGAWNPLLGAVPRLCGFPPDDALVAVGVQQGRIAVVVCVPAPGTQTDTLTVAGTVDAAMAVAHDLGAREFVLIRYGDTRESDVLLRLGEAWARGERRPGPVRLHVSGGRYACLCRDFTCPDRAATAVVPAASGPGAAVPAQAGPGGERPGARERRRAAWLLADAAAHAGAVYITVTAGGERASGLLTHASGRARRIPGDGVRAHDRGVPGVLSYPHRGAGRWAGLVGAVPAMLGRDPGDALVAIVLRAGRVGSIDDVRMPSPAAGGDAVVASIERLIAGAGNDPDTGLLLIGFGDLGAGQVLLDLGAAQAARAGLRVDGLVHVRGDHIVCRCGGAACSGGGADATADAPAAAARRMLLPDDMAGPEVRRARGHAAARLAGALRSSEDPLIDDQVRMNAWIRDAVTEAAGAARAAYRAGGRAGDDEVAWLALLLDHRVARHRVLAGIGDRPADLALWCDVTRRAAPHLVAGPAVCAGLAAARRRERVIGAVATGLALSADRHDPQARALARFFRTDMSATALAGLYRAIRPDAASSAGEPGAAAR